MPHPHDPASWDYMLDPPDQADPGCAVCGGTDYALDDRGECPACASRRCEACGEVTELTDDGNCVDCHAVWEAEEVAV